RAPIGRAAIVHPGADLLVRDPQQFELKVVEIAVLGERAVDYYLNAAAVWPAIDCAARMVGPTVSGSYSTAAIEKSC
ncbi:MAG TPA: hypothetical protein VET87_25800, partial [Rubrivivax sp.]|nr:hypothetical protein [Rubrivivax sp.]